MPAMSRESLTTQLNQKLSGAVITDDFVKVEHYVDDILALFDAYLDSQWRPASEPAMSGRVLADWGGEEAVATYCAPYWWLAGVRVPAPDRWRELPYHKEEKP